jgi:tricorn protease interacting factor F2/3
MEVINYNIKLDVDFKAKKYTGVETVKIKDAEDKITFDLNKIDIHGIKINGNGVKYESTDEGVSFPANGGDISIEVEFSSDNDRGLKGFYVAGTENSYILSTQFEESDARRAFPCIDNPNYKAAFDITLKVDKDLRAISNMPVKSEKIENGKKVFEFEQTPKMATYLVYLGVGQFDELEDSYKGKKIFLTAMKGHLTGSGYPLDTAKKSLNYLETYTGIDYMLPKLNLISVPEFAAGAMENWGAITFREILLNIDKSTTSRSYKRVSEVITHELVHMWFGDLVTMKWWNDLWLNESFATFLAFKTVDNTNPDWKFFGDFLLDQADGAYTMDALKNSHPINADVSDPRSISQLSYEIRYGKGSNVLRMIEAYAGKDVFMKAMRNYLKEFSYKNASGSDLWNAIEKESGKGISAIMEQWISQKGYPYITTERSGDFLKISQKQFYFLEGDKNSQWKIPLFINRFSSEEKSIMEEEEMKIDGDILSLNFDHEGFYRVLYDDAMFDNISKNLSQITANEKWGIANDLYAFLLSGKISMTRYVRRLEKLYGVNENIVIDEISKQLSNLYIITNNGYFRDLANFYMKDKLEYIETNKKDDFNFKITLSGLYAKLAYVNKGFCSSLLKKYNDYESVDPDFRLAYLVAHAKINNDFQYFAGIIQNTTNDEDKTKAITASGTLEGSKNHDAIMEFVKSGKAKKQDMDSFFVAMSASEGSRQFILDNVKNIVDTLYKFELSPLRINRCVQSMIGNAGIKDPEKMRENTESIRRDEIFGGINKGLEFLEVYENLIKNTK